MKRLRKDATPEVKEKEREKKQLRMQKLREKLTPEQKEEAKQKNNASKKNARAQTKYALSQAETATHRTMGTAYEN